MTLTSAAAVTRVVVLALARDPCRWVLPPVVDGGAAIRRVRLRSGDVHEPDLSDVQLSRHRRPAAMLSASWTPGRSSTRARRRTRSQAWPRARTRSRFRRPCPPAFLRATAYGWTVDLTPPTTQVTGRPPALTNSTTATFTFTSPDPTATFRCSLNGAPAQQCTSPVVYSGLADGTRSLLIQAVDPAGNVDPTAQPIVWTVDSTPPDTAISNPGNVVGNDVVVFSFTSTEAGSTFQCAFGNAPFAACTSPDAVDVPGSGAHVFKVRAIDGAGNIDPTPAVYRWTSDLTPPKRPKVTIFPDPIASAGRVAPVPVAQRNPGLGVTFTNPAANILSTPAFTLATRLRAQWSSDSTAKSYDVTIDEFPQDSTGMGFHGEELDTEKQYSRTKRTALVLHLYPGATVCVKVDANDKVGNTSRTRTSCTTIPISFTPRDVGPQPIKDAKAFRGYYIILGDKGYEFVQDIGDEFYFAPTHAAIVAERCGSCGVVEFDFDRFVGNPHNKLHTLATVNLTGSNKAAISI